jgi:hypothetical protein
MVSDYFCSVNSLFECLTIPFRMVIILLCLLSLFFVSYLFMFVGRKYKAENFLCKLCFTATSLFKMLLKYRPEDKAAKKERLLKRAQAENEGKTVEAKKPIVVKYGLNHVTYLIEQVGIYHFILSCNYLLRNKH